MRGEDCQLLAASTSTLYASADCARGGEASEVVCCPRPNGPDAWARRKNDAGATREREAENRRVLGVKCWEMLWVLFDHDHTKN